MELLLYFMVPFLVLLALGVPVAFSLGLPIVGFLAFARTTVPLTAVPEQMFAALNSFPLIALPLFVLAGALMNRLGVTDRLMEFAEVLVGWMRGGLAQISIVVSMFFAGISGSAIAEATAIGSLLIPAMKKQRYDADFAAAVVAAASVMGPIIPPSVPMIIIGAMLGISIGGLFLAGMVPGLLIGLSLMILTAVLSRRRGYVPASAFPSPRRFAAAALRALPALLAPLIILGGITFGVFTSTEAGAVATAYSLALGAAYRRLTLESLYGACLETARLTAAALFIVSVAVVFSRILSLYQAPQKLLAVLVALTENKLLLLLLINLFLFIAGMLMDAVANLLILGPLLFPVLTGLGLHPLHAGAMIVLNLLIGLITPPMAMCLFITCSIAQIGLADVTRVIIPFILVEIAILLLVTYVPWVTLAVPRAAGFF
ncbi:MAG TPA: TRAP transporter large permease [Solirubrobacterales bacterium]|nr:TRAP transporter large permease [Solirubrobacterales bacterium]